MVEKGWKGRRTVARDRYRRKHCDRIHRLGGGGLEEGWCYSNGTWIHWRSCTPTKDILFARDWICDSFSLFASIHPPPSLLLLLPTLASTYSSAPRSLRFIHATFPSFCTRRGNNKDRGHVYHTLLDTRPLPPRTSLRAASSSSIQRCSFRSRMHELWDTRDVLKKNGGGGGGGRSEEWRRKRGIRLLCTFGYCVFSRDLRIFDEFKSYDDSRTFARV